MVETATQMRLLKPPAGFSWVGDALTSDGTNKTVKNIAGLYKWAKEHGIGLVPNGDYIYVSDNYHDAYVYSGFKATPKKFESQTVKYFGTGTFVGGCGHSHPVGTWKCDLEGGRFGLVLTCQGCYRGGLKVSKILTDIGSVWLCAMCYDTCTKCGTEPVYLAQRSRYKGDAKTQCNKCCPVYKCQGCGGYTAEHEGKFEVKLHGSAVKFIICYDCHSGKICDICGCWAGRGAKPSVIEGKRHCSPCATKHADKERAKHEKWDAEELPTTGNLVIPSLPERPYRIVSIETEVDGDKDYLSNTLYNCGIVRVPVVESYGTPPPEKSEWAAFLKHDGSVSGGELISYLLQLDKSDHADAFLTTLSKVRSLAKVGKVQFNSNCGGHIHIDAHNFDSANVWRLLTTWNFLEDVIYRLAGAGHSYGHRTQDPGHDRANNGRGYANTPAKGPWGVKSTARAAWMAQDRMCGLNFKPYINAISSCICGAAGRDRLRECTCSLPKCTIEWRVWNSQGNPRIIHAWIAFMQAVHAFADVDEEPTAQFEQEHPTLAWTLKKFSQTTLSHQKAVKERLEWIFGNLVLTEAERDSLIYTIKQTDMKSLGDAYIEGLRKIPAPKNVAPRKEVTPRFARAKKIVIKEPAPGANPLEGLSRAERERMEYQLRYERGRARIR